MSQHFEVFLPSFSLSSLQLDYLNLDPPVLQSPAASISFAPNFCKLLTFWERNIPFSVLSSFIIVILWLVWNCGNALKETFGRWTWYWKCPFPLSWSYASLTIYPSKCAFMEVLSFALFNNSNFPKFAGRGWGSFATFCAEECFF